MARVVLKNVTKKFKDVVAVDDISIDIEDKEFAVLVGPSGWEKYYFTGHSRTGRGNLRRDLHRRPPGQ